MIRILIRNKIYQFRNGYFKAAARHRHLRRWFALLVTGWIFYFLMSWSRDFFQFILNSPDLSPDPALRMLIVSRLVAVMFNGLFLFLFMGGISISIYYIWGASDLPLLLSIPIPLRTVFTFKIIEEILVNSGFFFLLGGAILMGLGWSLQAPVGYYCSLIFSAIWMATLPTTLALFFTLWLLRLWPVTRTREISHVLTALVSFGFWLLIQFFRLSTLDPDSAVYTPDRIAWLQRLTRLPALAWTPGVWFSSQLAPYLWHTPFFSVRNLFNWSSVLLLAIIFFRVSVHFAQKHYLKSGTFTPNLPFKNKTLIPDNQPVEPSRYGRASRWWSLWWKDWQLMRRDPRLLMQFLLITIILICFVFMFVPKNPGREWFDNQPPVGIVLMAIFFTTQLASRAIPLEGRFFWQWRALPISIGKLVWTKFSFHWILNQLVLSSVLGFSLIYFRSLLPRTGLLFGFCLILSCGSTALGILAGSIGPRFNWEHPKRMLTSFGTLAWFGFAIIWGILLSGWYWVSLELAGLRCSHEIIYLGGSGVLAFTISVLSLNLARWRLFRLEPESGNE